MTHPSHSFLWRVVLLAAVAVSITGRAAETPVTVRVDPRVELMSVIFRLAGNPEYGACRVPAYAADVDAHFSPHRGHEVVVFAARLRKDHGISYDAVMSMAVHVTDVVTLAEAVPFDPLPEDLDGRWRVGDARRFLELAREFAATTDFAAFIESHQPLYDLAGTRAAEVLAEHAHLDWFETFFGRRPGARFTVVLGMLNGGNCYGARISPGDGNEDLYCILGVWATDWRGQPRFEAGMVGTVVHEFCHSYVNPIVDAHLAELEPAGLALYPLVEDAMRSQAYSNWKTMMRESLVRAGTVRYYHAVEGGAAGAKHAQYEAGRHFAWVPELSDLLADYEADRETYPTLDALMPRIVAFFDDYAPRFAEKKTEASARTPVVLAMVPPNGAADVDPGLTSIRVTFDRPMQDGNWSFVGGGPKFPETTGRPSYDETRTIVTLPVRLERDRDYEFWLNGPPFTGFRSEDGVPLESMHVTFRTSRPDDSAE